MHNNEREILNRIAYKLKEMSDLIIEKNHKWHVYANEEFKKKIDEMISIELNKIEIENKEEPEWIDVMSIPEFMGDTPEERIKTYIAYKNTGIKIEKTR